MRLNRERPYPAGLALLPTDASRTLWPAVARPPPRPPPHESARWTQRGTESARLAWATMELLAWRHGCNHFLFHKKGCGFSPSPPRHPLCRSRSCFRKQKLRGEEKLACVAARTGTHVPRLPFSAAAAAAPLPSPNPSCAPPFCRAPWRVDNSAVGTRVQVARVGAEFSTSETTAEMVCVTATAMRYGRSALRGRQRRVIGCIVCTGSTVTGKASFKCARSTPRRVGSARSHWHARMAAGSGRPGGARQHDARSCWRVRGAAGSTRRAGH